MAGKTILAITCLALLVGCGPKPDLTPCNGWTGGTPRTEQEFALAASAEKRGLACANIKLQVARKFYQPGY